MSWLARSLVDSLGIDDDDDQNPQKNHDVSPDIGNNRSFYNESSFFDLQNQQYRQRHEDEDQSRGVKEDLSEFKESLTRQLLGVANFLAPPPPPLPPPPRLLAAPFKCPDQIKVSDFDSSELSGPSVSCHDGLSNQDQPDRDNVDVRGISRFSGSDRAQLVAEGLQYDKDCEQLTSREELGWIPQAVGVTDEVLAFAGNIAHHPETWLDFPVEEEDDLDDFDMSESQREHAFAIECLTPRLKALRIELCPALLSDGYFWKVYFVLLHSRLNKHDAKILSTSRVAEARAEWMQELQKRNKEELERQRFYKENAFMLDDLGTSSPCSQHPDNYSLWTFSSEPACSSISCDSETEKHPTTSSEPEYVDKSVIEETLAIKNMVDKHLTSVMSNKLLLDSFDDDDIDNEWPEDDFVEDGKGVVAIPLGIEEEVSFSDLEDDDCSIHTKYNINS